MQLLSEQVTLQWSLRKPTAALVLDENFGTEEYAVGMRKEDTELCKEINKAMQELKDDGTFDTIKDTWFQ